MQDTSAPVGADEPLDAEDIYAGKMLGWMLGGHFFYTIVSSLYVFWWTWNAIGNSQFQ